jgi:hypothetical protein
MQERPMVKRRDILRYYDKSFPLEHTNKREAGKDDSNLLVGIAPSLVRQLEK